MKTKEQKIQNRISLLFFILLTILLWFLLPQTNNESEYTEEVKAEQIDSKTEEKQETTQEAELRIYNQIIGGNEYKAYVYWVESKFAYNNIYLPVKEVNPDSGKIGICQLNTSHGDDLWEQDAKCESYMESRYGSWETAAEHERNEGWW